MTSEHHQCSIYIDLDSILDFRLATVSRLDDDLAASLMTEAYLDRHRDAEFFAQHGLNAEQYIAEYRKRDASYLIGAKPTAIFWLLGKIISENMITTPGPKGFRQVELVINTFPFVLSPDATAVLENAVSIYLDGKFHIRSINEDPAQLYPVEMKTRYTDIIMYDFNYWVMAHHGVITQSNMHPAVIYTPAIMRGYEPDREKMADLESEFKDNLNPFEWTSQWLMDVVSLRYVDARHFSVELFKHPVGTA